MFWFIPFWISKLRSKEWAPAQVHTGETRRMGPGSKAYRGDGGGLAPAQVHTGETLRMGPGSEAYRGDGGGWASGSNAYRGDGGNGPRLGGIPGRRRGMDAGLGHSGETIRGSGPWGKTIASCGLLLGTLLFFIRVCRLADNRHFDLECIMK